MSKKTYRVRPDITHEQICAAVDALNPFYGFGAVLATANEKDGTASICLYDGKEDQADDSSLFLEAVEPGGKIISISGSWYRVPAVYMGPILTAQNFFAARDAFLSCVENCSQIEEQAAQPRSDEVDAAESISSPDTNNLSEEGK